TPAACHCSRARRLSYYFSLSRHPLHPCFRQSRSPAETDPLLDVIGHTCPEGFHPYLEEPPETELPEAYPLFDPGMGEFGDCRPLLVDLLRLFRFHLLREGDNRRVIDTPHDRTHVRLPGAALLPMGTRCAVLPAAPVPMVRPSGAFDPSVAPQDLSLRTGVGVACLVVGKVFGTEGAIDSPLRKPAGRLGGPIRD